MAFKFPVFVVQLCLIITFGIGILSSPQEKECVNGIYASVTEFIDDVDDCTFRRDNFNPDCVAASCPQLTTQPLCATSEDGNVNRENVEKILEIVTECLKLETICGVDLNPIPCPSETFSVAEMLTGTSFTGQCKMFSDTCSLHYVNNTVLSLIDTDEPLTILISSPGLLYNSSLDCVFQSQIRKTASVPVNNIICLEHLNITVKSRLSLKSRSKPNVQESTIKVITKYSSFDSLPILGNAGIKEALIKSDQHFIEASPIANVFGKFIFAILSNAVEAANMTCKI